MLKSADAREDPIAYDENTRVLGSTRDEIRQECHRLEALLLEKNARYGDSAMSPMRIMAASDSPLEQIAVRIDDKLKRIQNMGGLQAVLSAAAPDGEDTVQDLLGYLVLARVCAARTQAVRDMHDGPLSQGVDEPR